MSRKNMNVENYVQYLVLNLKCSLSKLSFVLYMVTCVSLLLPSTILNAHCGGDCLNLIQSVINVALMVYSPA